MIVLSIGFYKLAFFHLLTHAIFKALLFICAGSIIHNIINSQDIRSIGGLCLNIPLTSSFFNIANLALCGMPFIAGFYSKDLILEMSSFSYLNIYIYIIYFFSTGLTVSYSFRLVYYSIVGDFNSISLHPINDERWLILKSILILVFISIIRGSFLGWLIFPTPYMICLPIYIKLLTIFVCIVGGVSGYLISTVSLYFYNKSLHYNKLIFFFRIIWFIPFIFTNFSIKVPLKIGILMKLIDQG
jgi:NADH-ubiquinone oxidoreductase chain 5